MPEFKEIADSIRKSGKPQKMSVRELIQSIGKERRGKYVSRSLRNKLKYNKLATEPDFEAVHIDSVVLVKPLAQASEPAKPPVNGKPAESKHVVTHESPEGERDVVLTIGQLPAAARTPVFIRRDECIERAVTLLMQENLTHLVVSQNERIVDGLVSWQSIGRARASQKPDKMVSDCMDPDPHVVSYTAALFDTVRHIISAGAVLVKGADKRISGVVTGRDIAEQFITLSEPFLYLEQCESQLRALLRRAKPNAELLRSFVDPRDEGRKNRLKDLDDLTFGETIRLLAAPSLWDKLKLGLDRKTVVLRLEEVREIRNTVMHFHPDGITDEERDLLRKTRQMLQDL